MHFVIIGKDGDDPEALNRRMAARDSHIAYSDLAVKTGEQVIGAAVINQEGQMAGSIMIVEFDDIEGVKSWLDKEAYVTGKVWQDIQIIPCKIAPSFEHLIKKP
jgi:hypothetical protein